MPNVRSFVVMAVVGAGLLMMPRPAAAQQTIACASDDGRYELCRVDTRGGVRLQQQLSRTECVYHQNWGYNRSGVWVNSGCRGVFEVGSPGWHDSSSGSWSGGHGQAVRCESWDGRVNHCRADTHQGVRLDHQLSGARCQYGRDWGYDHNSIWVANGCRAEFEIGHTSHGGGFSGHSSYSGHTGSVGTVTCASESYRRSYCPAYTRNGVRLERQESHNAECVQNRTWGYDSGGIWVSDGCRGVFALGDPDFGHSTTHQSSHHADSDAGKVAAAALVIGAIAAIAASQEHDKGRNTDDDWN